MSSILGDIVNIENTITGLVDIYADSVQSNTVTSNSLVSTDVSGSRIDAHEIYIDGVPVVAGGSGGSSSTITVGTTTTLEAGTAATVTNSGSNVNAVFNFGIPAGIQGEAATVVVGSTTTLNTGEDATCTNSGNSQYAVLNFGIPRGEKGDKGDKGDRGHKGDDGASTIAAIAAAATAGASAAAAAGSAVLANSSATAAAASAQVAADAAAAAQAAGAEDVSELRSKTFWQTGYPLENKTRFQHKLEVTDQYENLRIQLDGNSRKIVVGSSIVGEDEIRVGSGTTYPTTLTAAGVQTDTVYTRYIEAYSSNNNTYQSDPDINIGKYSTSDIHIGNPLLNITPLLRRTIYLHGKVDFGTSDVVGSVFQFDE